MLFAGTKVTVQSAEETWEGSVPEHYLGAPVLVRDADGRVPCYACQLCELIASSGAVKDIPSAIPAPDRLGTGSKSDVFFPQCGAEARDRRDRRQRRGG